MAVQNLEEDFSPLQFGFQGEGIVFTFKGKKQEIGSTWIDGRRIYLDGLTDTNLNDDQKRKLFSDILQFSLEKENEKPIICYTSDFKDGELWNQLSQEFQGKIKSVEIKNTAERNKNYYKQMLDGLVLEKTEYRIRGLKIKTVEDLDQHWNKIKYVGATESNEKVSLWDKIQAFFY